MYGVHMFFFLYIYRNDIEVCSIQYTFINWIEFYELNSRFSSLSTLIHFCPRLKACSSVSSGSREASGSANLQDPLSCRHPCYVNALLVRTCQPLALSTDFNFASFLQHRVWHEASPQSCLNLSNYSCLAPTEASVEKGLIYWIYCTCRCQLIDTLRSIGFAPPAALVRTWHKRACNSGTI